MCYIYDHKIHALPAPLHPVVVIGPFAKWGIIFMTCNSHWVMRHGCIIFVVDYFTKWGREMPTYKSTGETTAYFFFNYVIYRFGAPQAIVMDHGKHFRNHMMTELTANLGLLHENSTPYYPQANG